MPAILAAVLVVFSASGFAQEKARDTAQHVAIIDIQAAIARSKDGQAAIRDLQDKFAPKRVELEDQQREISDLQNQLRNQEKTLSDEARTRLLRTLDDKTRRLNRDNEDATAEFQQAQQDVINGIGRKILGVISEHAQENGFSLVLDISSPQNPVLYANETIDITQAIIEQYDAAAAAAEAAAAEAAAAVADKEAVDKEAAASDAAETSAETPENPPAATP
ncbi:MAG: OmpH family outer membrane protein [Acidobacteria bacterium]|nr:OmpH family outer membrane protein [Acidobacteriota bacterium]